MADAAECSDRTTKNIRRNLRLFGTVHVPLNRVGRRRTITPPMLDALREHLLEKPGLYLDEMVIFIWDEFRILATTSSIRRALSFTGLSKKSIRQRPRNRMQNYGNSIFITSHNLSRTTLSMLTSLVVINESDSEAPVGHHSVLLQSKCHSFTVMNGIKYSQRTPKMVRIVLSRVFRGSTDAGVSKIFSTSFFDTVEDGRSRNPF